MTRKSWQCGWIGLLLLLAGCASAQEGLPTRQPEPPPIAIIAQDGFNLAVVDQLNPYYVIVQLASPAHNWFAGTFTNLPTDKEVTIGLSMAGNDTKGNAADVKKWQGLVPVMTYADPAKYETYEWFVKDAQGRWGSGDPLKQGEAKLAGTGKVPAQTALPQEVAEQFLSADGTYWSAWREVDKAEAVPGVNVFRITQRFALPSATVAMRVPYTYTYLQAFIEKLRAAKLPGISIDECQATPGKRKLQFIRIDDSKSSIKAEDRPTVLVIAREHATEHTSSWVLHGMLSTLLSPDGQALRQNSTWLFVPIEDPDGSANANFDRLADAFCKANDPATPSEVFSYAQYLTDYVNAGRPIHVAVTLHNVEANETPHVFCPFIEVTQKTTAITINRSVFEAMKTAGFLCGAPDQPWDTGYAQIRLFGWVGRQFGTLPLAYEINDRLPSRRLSMQQVMQVGSVLLTRLAAWHTSPDGIQHRASVAATLAARKTRRDAYFAQQPSRPQPIKRSKGELLLLGY